MSNNNGNLRANRDCNKGKKRKADALLDDLIESPEIDDYEKIYNDSFDLYIKEIRKRFDTNKLKPLIDIYNLVCDQVFLIDNVKKSFFLYRFLVNLDKLKIQVINWYEYKSLNKLNDFDAIVTHLKNNKCVQESFSEIVVLIKIYLTVGLVSVECERALSCLKRIKTYDRTTMCQSRLSALGNFKF